MSSPPPPPPPPPPSTTPTAPTPHQDVDTDFRPLLAPSNPKQLSENEWKKLLSEDEYHVTREKGTEEPFTGKYNNFKADGTYHCSNCSTHLFDSDSKYNAGCGWPSFYRANEQNLEKREDLTDGLVRTEVTCRNCGAHQGHVFEDGPEVHGGVRYCINSASLRFKKKDQK